MGEGLNNMPQHTLSDRDLLMILNTKMDDVSDSIKSIETDVRAKADLVKVQQIENDLKMRAESGRVDEIELKLEEVQKRTWMMMGGIVVLQAVLRFVKF